MDAIGIHSGKSRPSFLHINKPNPKLSSNPVLFMPNLTKKTPSKPFSLSITSSNFSILSKKIVRTDAHDKDAIFSEKIESWIEGSLVDIVKRLKQAPLLVQINSSESGNGKFRVKTEKAMMEKWEDVRNEWKDGESKSPDGLIFVGELDKLLGDDENIDQEFEEGVTRAWGVVVQGKGIEHGPVCYLLKTCRVGAGLGLGLHCTHFCLVRVNSFRDSAMRQFKDCWLLQR